MAGRLTDALELRLDLEEEGVEDRESAELSLVARPEGGRMPALLSNGCHSSGLVKCLVRRSAI